MEINIKKIYKVTCPTNSTKNYLISLNIVDKKKICVLQDPVLDVNKSRRLKEQKHDIKIRNYLFAAGRLTKQKNFELLIDGFNRIHKNHPKINLVIAGDGELKKKLKSKINNLNLNHRIHLVGFKNNIFKYMKNSQGYVLSSLWEDPGFVLIEAAFCRAPVITSDCQSGPREIVNDNTYGYIFKSDNLNDFTKTLDIFLNDLSNNKNLIKSKKKTFKENKYLYKI